MRSLDNLTFTSSADKRCSRRTEHSPTISQTSSDRQNAKNIEKINFILKLFSNENVQNQNGINKRQLGNFTRIIFIKFIIKNFEKKTLLASNFSGLSPGEETVFLNFIYFPAAVRLFSTR